MTELRCKCGRYALKSWQAAITDVGQEGTDYTRHRRELCRAVPTIDEGTEAEPCGWCGEPIDPQVQWRAQHHCHPRLVAERARADERRKVLREVVEWLRSYSGPTWNSMNETFAAEIERRFGKTSGDASEQPALPAAGAVSTSRRAEAPTERGTSCGWHCGGDACLFYEVGTCECECARCEGCREERRFGKREEGGG